MTMIAVQVMGNDTAIGIAGSQGNFELNVFKPVMIHNLLHSIRLFVDAIPLFVKYLIEGIEPNELQIRRYVENSLMLVTALTPHIGYDKAAKVAHKAFVDNTTLKAACLELAYLTESEFDNLVRPEKMISP
jgi:fumarate hydratase class II